MSDHDAAPAAHGQDHAPAGHDAAHDDAGHGGGHGGHGDGHGGEALGPIDWTMWGVGVLGVVSAVLVVACLVVATSFVFTA